MMAFEISVNGRQVATIGVGEAGVLNVIMSWVASGPRNDGVRLHAGGISLPTDDHVGWKMPAISLGDVVTIKVVESDEITPEAERFPVEEGGHRP
jgi:hypothetical protein